MEKLGNTHSEMGEEAYRVGTTMRRAKVNRPWIWRDVAQDNIESGFQKAHSCKSEEYT